MTTTVPTERTVTTRRGIEATVRVRGSGGPPVVWFHGTTGLLDEEPLLDRLAADHLVYAPEWPGFGTQPTEASLFDMLDFTLHGWDLVEALELGEPPHVIGHSMGGMIAAEMAAVAPGGMASLTLVAAAGLWLDEHPVPDLFAMLPFEIAGHLFVDAEAGQRLLTAGHAFADDRALIEFMVGNSRRMGTAGKILFPIPDRRLADRLYRVTCPTLIVWGAADRLYPPAYARRLAELLTATTARVEVVDAAGHMVPYEAADQVCGVVNGFVSGVARTGRGSP